MTREEREKVFRENAIDCALKLQELWSVIHKMQDIVKKYGLDDVTQDDVGSTISGFEYEMILALREDKE